ncbi:NEL-type E3 ubiquitin ligase domain-containing protein [unidentified bacterial endosymbiont]|uniref:NEL-type E3 ubiquitin ligase domain-containing protein n=1 Tax=unidentified bacterial endosymbiont TaxID=2355 RepID=UPI00209F4FF6|nr:NEL-type E3 ubiquitin ligase domain-containing protein [unidentified bacterial endosymbiont]
MPRFINNTVTPTACSRWAPTTAYSHQSYHARPYTRHYSVSRPLLPACHLINPSRRPAPSDVMPRRYQNPFQTSGGAIRYSVQPTVYRGYSHSYAIKHAPKIMEHDYRKVPQRTAQASFLMRSNPLVSSQTYAPSPPAFVTAPYRETAPAAPSRSTVRVASRPAERQQAATAMPQTTYTRSVPQHWTASSSRIYAPSPLAFTTRPYQATTPAAAHAYSYAVSPLAFPTLAYRAPAAARTYPYAVSPLAFPPRPHRESAQVTPSRSTVSTTSHSQAAVPQAAISTPQPTQHQSGERPVDQARVSSTRLQTSNTLHQRASSPPSLFRRADWAAFEGVEGSDSFYTLLQRLKEHHQKHPQDQVPRRLEALYQTMSRHPELCTAVFNEAQIGAESCSDRAIATLNQLETRCAIEESIQGKKIDDQALLTIMRGLFRQEELYKIADLKVKQLDAQKQSLPENQRSTFIVDSVETHLFYHIALKERLQLPGGTKSMTFTKMANVTDQEAQRAGDKILRIEKLDPNSLINFITKNEHWQRYLEQHYQSLHDQDESIAHYGARMEQLEEASEQQEINEEEYLQRCHQLMQEQQTASKAWFLAKTQALIHKHLTPQGYPIASNG